MFFGIGEPPQKGILGPIARAGLKNLVVWWSGSPRSPLSRRGFLLGIFLGRLADGKIPTLRSKTHQFLSRWWNFKDFLFSPLPGKIVSILNLTNMSFKWGWNHQPELIEEIWRENQLRLVVYPVIYRVLAPSKRWVFSPDFWTINKKWVKIRVPNGIMYIPLDPCMVYLRTFGWFLWSM